MPNEMPTISDTAIITVGGEDSSKQWRQEFSSKLYAPLIFEFGFTVLLFFGIFQLITFESRYIIPVSFTVYLIFIYFIIKFSEMRLRR